MLPSEQIMMKIPTAKVSRNSHQSVYAPRQENNLSSVSEMLTSV